MKTNKMLKVTGIMQSVLIGILLLFAICIEVMSRMNFYTYDYSLNFDYSSFWAIHLGNSRRLPGSIHFQHSFYNLCIFLKLVRKLCFICYF